MKTAAIPAVRVSPELRQAAEEVLRSGETLSGFVEDAVRRNVEFRHAQKAFIEPKGMMSSTRASVAEHDLVDAPRRHTRGPRQRVLADLDTARST